MTTAGEQLMKYPITTQVTCKTCGILLQGLTQAIQHLDAHN